MAARVLVSDVVKIFPSASDDPTVLQTFIDTAHLLVSEELSTAGLSEERLTTLELYLAAHYASIALERGGLQSQRLGDGQEEYRVIDGRAVGLASTRYGQQVLILDTSGTLAALSQRPVKALFRVCGDPNVS